MGQNTYAKGIVAAYDIGTYLSWMPAKSTHCDGRERWKKNMTAANLTKRSTVKSSTSPFANHARK
jgi:hypothetical protein